MNRLEKRTWITGLPLLLLALLLTGSLGGCGFWEDSYEEAASPSFSVAVLQGPGALSLLKAMAPELPPDVRLGDTVAYTLFEDETQIHAQLTEKKSQIALIPTAMFATLAQGNPDYELAAVSTDGTDASLPMSCLVVRRDVLTDQAEAWNLFLEDYKDSIQWISEEPDKAAKLLETHDEIGIPVEQAEEVIGRANLIFLDGDQAVQAVEQYLNLSPQ